MTAEPWQLPCGQGMSNAVLSAVHGGHVGRAVQELLGHANMTMSTRYAHLSPEVWREAVGLLNLPVSNTLAAHERKSA